MASRKDYFGLDCQFDSRDYPFYRVDLRYYHQIPRR